MTGKEMTMVFGGIAIIAILAFVVGRDREHRSSTPEPDLPTAPDDNFVPRSTLGVRLTAVESLTSIERGRLGIGSSRGVVIDYLAPGGPAERAGIRRGDLVLTFAGEPVTSVEDLRHMIGRAGAGTTLAMQISRSGRLQDVRVTLGGPIVQETDSSTRLGTADTATTDTPDLPTASGRITLTWDAAP